MKSDRELKNIVRQKYHEIAIGNRGGGGCCGSGSIDDFSFADEDYTTQEGYNPDADLNLGCGIPTGHAGIEQGMTVLDLGSGAGNDVFIARQLVGSSGRVIGVDMAPGMNERAEANRKKLGYENVEFRPGEIEDLPLDDNEVDVVISNCVLNLVPDKEKAFSEMYRVLKMGGHFSVSDIVLIGDLDNELKEIAELHAGCVSGALPEPEYIRLLEKAGFEDIEIKVRREIVIPYEYVSKLLSPDAWKRFRNSGNGIFSITVNGYKAD